MSDDVTVLPPIDRENLFLLYSTFCGDIEKTAHASGLRPLDVLRVVDECNWTEKLKAIFALKKSSAQGDVERGINRAVSFAQSHRMRMLLDRCVTKLTNMSDEELTDILFVPDKLGVRRLTTRALTDLAAAAEKCAAQAAQALQDTAADRARREEAVQGGESSGSLHASICAAMAAVGRDASPRALLVEAQLAQAQEVVKTTGSPAQPPDPYSVDDH